MLVLLTQGPKELVLPGGFEPPTSAFGERCSSAELRELVCYGGYLALRAGSFNQLSLRTLVTRVQSGIALTKHGYAHWTYFSSHDGVQQVCLASSVRLRSLRSEYIHRRFVVPCQQKIGWGSRTRTCTSFTSPESKAGMLPLHHSPKIWLAIVDSNHD